jgi:hypothetical protein
MHSTVSKPIKLRASREDLRGQFQRHLAGFVESEIQLGHTFAALAATEQILGNTQHFRIAKGDAAKAMATIRKFLNRIEDNKVRASTANRCDELERKIENL